MTERRQLTANYHWACACGTAYNSPFCPACEVPTFQDADRDYLRPNFDGVDGVARYLEELSNDIR